MSTPQNQPPKGPRRSSRRLKNQATGTSEPDHNVSDSGPSVAEAKQTSLESPTTRRKSQGAKRTYTPKPERAFNVQPGLPQPNPANISQRQSTPLKQAYAGPTFHSSPAPSSLPIPSFYSKSMPTVPTVTIPDIAEESGTNAAPEAAIDDNTTDHTGIRQKRESTPLDFLFEAARRQRETPQAQSPANRSADLTAFGDSPIRRSPAPREGGSETVFPFELDGNGNGVQASNVGPAFATPYRERINALRSASASPRPTLPTLAEQERRAKSEALKKLLMNANPGSELSESAENPSTDPENPFNAKAPAPRYPPRSSFQTRHQSGPSTPVISQSPGVAHYFPNFPATSHEFRVNASPVPRPASSHLRRQYNAPTEETGARSSISSTSQATPISTARKPAGIPQTPRQLDQYRDLTDKDPIHQPRPSAQQLEDDLRRVLKLDITSRG